MLINRARAFYERTAALRANRTTSYLVGLTAIALTMLARFLFANQLMGFPFLTFFPAIIVTSFICGWRAGAVAAVFGGFAARYFFMDGSFDPIRIVVTSSWVGYALYAFAVAIVLSLVASMHAAFHDFAESENRRARLNTELESRVRERTVALEEANQRLRDDAASLAAAEARIRQMQKMEAVGQLTGGIAHDFNNMLAVIVGSLDIARRHLHEDLKKSERFIANALEGAQRGAQLTARLLAFSRQQPLDPRSLDTNKLMRETSELLRRSLGENIRLQTELLDGPWRIFADASQLESALVNLCINSRDSMPDGGTLTLRTTNVDLSAADAAARIDVRPGEYMALAVCDTGFGMSPEVLARAFDPFYTTKAPGQGTGLGLSQVYGFVKQSGGHIHIDSTPGIGTTVTMYLPRHHGIDQEEAAAPQDTPEAPGNREVILVVEDEDRVRTMTAEALRGLGYEVIAVSGPREALDELSTIPQLHLVLTDVVMPDMNGPALADCIKAVRPSVKVLYTTGYSRNAVLSPALDREAGVLPKPFTIDQLMSKVRQALDQRTRKP
ncbi:MAG: ATP-binding protein [Pseudomonadota bacterium]|nr:ATP-binding protein [Pseudomonadota bacterium]